MSSDGMDGFAQRLAWYQNELAKERRERELARRDPLLAAARKAFREAKPSADRDREKWRPRLAWNNPKRP